MHKKASKSSEKDAKDAQKSGFVLRQLTNLQCVSTFHRVRNEWKNAFLSYKAVNAIQQSQFHWVVIMKICIKYEVVYCLVETCCLTACIEKRQLQFIHFRRQFLWMNVLWKLCEKRWARGEKIVQRCCLYKCCTLWKYISVIYRFFYAISL